MTAAFQAVSAGPTPAARTEFHFGRLGAPITISISEISEVLT